jgi:hypothetical protein
MTEVQHSLGMPLPEQRKHGKPLPPIAAGVSYGPPEPVWRVPQPWGSGHYSIQRGAILGADDAGDDRSWLNLSRVKEPILVGVSVKRLQEAMPTLNRRQQ